MLIAKMINEAIHSRVAMRLMTSRSATILALILLLASGGTAQKKARVTGFYSDMHYIEEAGDVIGTEVWIVYARGSYWATVQVAEGAPEPPVVVPVRVSGQRVSFSVTEPVVGPDGRPAPGLVLKFDGTATEAALRGIFAGERVSLKRGNSYWQ